MCVLLLCILIIWSIKTIKMINITKLLNSFFIWSNFDAHKKIIIIKPIEAVTDLLLNEKSKVDKKEWININAVTQKDNKHILK